MSKKEIVYKITGWILLVALILGVFTPVVTSVFAASKMTQEEKLGSPLLDRTFDTNSWNPNELAVWGIFLSNFTVPLLDNYQSAFSEDSTEGTAGRGRRSILFGTDNNDSVTTKLLEYASNVQNESSRPVYIRQLKMDSVGLKIVEQEWREATLYDFISYNNPDGIKIRSNSGSNWTPVESMAVFGVKKPGEGDVGYETVFNTCDSYDIASYAALYTSALFNRTYGDDFKAAFSAYDTGDKVDMAKGTKLTMDVFGNITVYTGGRNIVVYPACSSQYITAEKSYNFLNSCFVNSRYINIGVEDMINKIKTNSWWMGDIFNDSKILSDGTIALAHTSDMVSQLEKGALNYLGYEGAEKYFNDSVKLYKEYKDYTNMSFNSKAYADIVCADLMNGKSVAPFKIQVKGVKNIDTYFGWGEGSLKLVDDYNNFAPVLISPTIKRLDEMSIFGKETYKLFESPVLVDVGTGISNKLSSKESVQRRYTYFLGKSYRNNVGNYMDIKGLVSKDATISSVADSINKSNGNTSKFYSDFLINQFGNLSGSGDESGDLTDYKFGEYSNTKYKDLKTVTELSSNVASIYSKGAVFNNVSAGLSCNLDGDSEITLFCKSMYYTYLKWYGVLSNEYNNKLNTAIYTTDSDLFRKNVSDFLGSTAMSEEEMKKEVLKRTYLMLDAEKGRELRKNIYRNSFNDTLFDWYCKIVYGTENYSATAEDEGGVAANQASQGFLGVDNYYNNPFTEWFVTIYDDIAIIILGIGIIIILIVWLLFKKRGIWILTSIALLVTVVLVTPSVGDIVPYVCDKMICNTFGKQLNYWALCENTENMRIEGNTDLTDINGDVISSDTQSLIQELNMNYSDRSLMLKYDISRKVTSSGIANLNELQNLKTSAWVLPQLLRQFSAENGSSDYVYVSMSDALKASRQLYGAYVPRAESDITATRMEAAYSSSDIRSTAWEGASHGIDYNVFGTGYGALESYGLGITPVSVNNSNPIHQVYFYLAGNNDETVKIPNLDIKTRDKATGDRPEATVDGSTANKLREFSELMERTGGLYNNFKNESIQKQYGYMWTTESPLIYMYFNMKDTYINFIESYSNLSGLTYTDDSGEVISAVSSNKINNITVSDRSRLKNMVDMIQGQYIESPEGGDKNRANFMYDGLTGTTKDFLDLRTLITNVAPYMYEMQLITGGNSGKDGIFGEEKVSLYPIYKNNYKSWIFRCNWAEKIFTNTEYNSKYKITVDGKRVTVDSQILPSCYEKLGRPMIFSEAEMRRAGLKETDLSIVELKCVEANKQTAKDITLLLNYVNMKGLTPEALVQQMSLIATMNFCQYLSPDNGFNNQMALYPQQVDLTNVSFDAVARVLMLGATNSTNYTYGNTMYNVIANSNIVSAILLLCVAFFCVSVIPLIRNLLMALLLFLGLFSTVTNFFMGNKVRWKVTVSYIINLILTLLLNMAFFGVLAMMMNIVSPTDILRDGSFGMKIHSPVIILFILGALCVFYIIAMWKMVVFTIQNYRDMGATMFTVMFSTIGSKITEGLTGIKDGLDKAFGNNNSVDDSTGEPLSKSQEYVQETMKEFNAANPNSVKHQEEYGTVDDSEESSAWTDGLGYVEPDNTDSEDIDNKVNKGRDHRR